MIPLFLALCAVGCPREQEEFVRKTFLYKIMQTQKQLDPNKISFKKYQLLKEICLLDLQFHVIWNYLIEKGFGNELFGNWYPQAHQIRLSWTQNLYARKMRNIKNRQRKRGYSDHGTLRLGTRYEREDFARPDEKLEIPEISSNRPWLEEDNPELNQRYRGPISLEHITDKELREYNHLRRKRRRQPRVKYDEDGYKLIKTRNGWVRDKFFSPFEGQSKVFLDEDSSGFKDD